MDDNLPGGEPPRLWVVGLVILVFVAMAAALVYGIARGGG